MHDTRCPACGKETAPGAACPICGHAATNGATRKEWVKPPPPPEVASWAIEPVPPELAEEFRRTFDEAAFLAEAEEALESGAFERRLDELSDEAVARGDGPAFAAAYAEFQRRLAIYPQFGDPQIDLKAQTGIIDQAIIRPLVLRYGVLENQRIVLCTAPPALLPMDRAEAPEGG
jgi:hypothetical protein